MIPFRHHFGDLLDARPEALLRLDDHGRVVWMNRAAGERCGEMRGRPASMLLHPDDAGLLERVAAHTVSGPQRCVARITDGSGGYRCGSILVSRTPAVGDREPFTTLLLTS